MANNHRLACIMLALTSISSQDVSARTVRIVLNDWASQQVISNVYSQLLEKVGFKTKFVSLPTDGQWYYLKYNYVDVQVEVWQGNKENKLTQLIESQSIQEAGTYSIKTREDWWYPSYVTDLCPQLPDWKALNNCAKVFSEGDDPRGVYYTGPWERNDSARIRALNLNYRVISLSDDASLVKLLQKAYNQKKPILIFNWTPNWVDTQYDGEFVEFPDYAPECETNPEWGSSKQFLYDCGNPKARWVKKVTAKEFPQAMPCAFDILRSMTFSGEELAQFSLQVNVHSQSTQQVGEQWLNQNQQHWQDWLAHYSCDAYLD
ncbi:ABC transporter substrate-binding protein [Pseudoalteromonas sp. T1lg23B]|uniref:ABC transporter substrate-binding protein n=1 Tax=Pseudoalteromonas sp. T1lg23B TaxID=2077097 RepID=UPI000CF6B38F|nr:ABC transporter substrate-binding protein [Pseudoalteromonas sp. T1lg23B]